MFSIKKGKKAWIYVFRTLLIGLVLLLSAVGCRIQPIKGVSQESYGTEVSGKKNTNGDHTKNETKKNETKKNEKSTAKPDPNGHYYEKDEVIRYLAEYGHLPGNYITKNKARERGWIPEKGNLWSVTNKMVIGGDRYGNYEKKLPKGEYREADVNYHGGVRGPERIIYNQEAIWYTPDHYEHFEKVKELK